MPTLCMGCHELRRQLKILDDALGIASELVAAISPLIPDKHSLNGDDLEKWQKVVNAVFKAAEYADKHNLEKWGGKISTAN